ncbi:MAG: hypothetical protein KA797_09405, partial [Chitinophagales bacterium]|nr:hypothetical protein [Chitinophagales bacterium]
MTFHHLTIKKITQETHDTVSLTFDIPAALQSAYAFQAGQYVNLRIDMNGNKQTRSYSICSVPSDTSIISVG